MVPTLADADDATSDETPPDDVERSASELDIAALDDAPDPAQSGPDPSSDSSPSR